MVQFTKLKPMRQKISTEAIYAIKRKRSSGFAFVSLIAMLPLLTTLLIVLGAFAYFMSKHTKASNQCINIIMNMQDQLSYELKNLLSKNKFALKLRTQEKIAKARLLAATASGNAVAILSAETRLMKVQLQRAQLGIEQQKILTVSKSLVAKTSIKLNSQMTEYKTKVSMPSGIAVEPDIISDTAPVYLLVRNFADQQMSKVKYSFTSAEFEKNPWLKQKTYAFTCAATIAIRGDTFRAALVNNIYE
jgi:hypothetical protein